VATLVSFHAHPDDEAIACGGTLARASAEGHRVVLVMATRGEHGDVADGLLGPGEELGQRRVKETMEAARILGVHRVEFLGYRDSGMMGAPANDAPQSFWRADVEQAARRVAAVLIQEQADVLTIYDEGGISGQPDHVQVHRVGLIAAHLAATPRVYELTINRAHLQRLMHEAARVGVPVPKFDVDPEHLGTPNEAITTTVDVRDYVAVKRRAMEAHASQLSEAAFLSVMPRELFAQAWGWEWFIRRGAAGSTRETSLFDGVPTVSWTMRRWL
jgi:LmbE family N-acetylglucosaminyl deacetylase